MEVERQAEDITRHGIELLEQNKDRRFFIFLHYYDPHSPYAAPESINREYSDPYLAEIAYVDEQFGKVMDALVEFASKAPGFIGQAMISPAL